MTLAEHHALENNLLRLLPPDVFDYIVPKLVFETLPNGSLLAETGAPIDRIYFLTAGIGSVVIATPAGRRAEAGIFGFDGYIPTSAVTGSRISSYDVRVQLDAKGHHLAYDDFRRLIGASKEFASVMNRSMESFAVQLAHTAVSNAVHEVPERLARWLLMCHDRIRGDEMALTHEFLAVMLGVRRPSVTTALHLLEGEHLIRARRGRITVRDRAALEAYARDAYGRPEAEYRRLMTDPFG
jgi:CRP-like cAMP-binding protein